MATGFAIFSAITATYAAYSGAKAQKSQARSQRQAAEREAAQAQERAKREEQLAFEKKESDILLAKERLEFETTARKEKADFTIGQMEKSAAMLKAAAIAGYAASGIDLEESSSALTVLSRIQKESEVETGEVREDYRRFSEARTLEFEQLKTTESLTYDWFTTRLHQETEWDVSNRYAEASAYRSKAKYAKQGMYTEFGSLAGDVGTKAYNYGWFD